MNEYGSNGENGSGAEGRSRIGLKDVLTVLSRRRWIVLGIAAPVIIISLVGTLRSTNVTTASAMVMLEMRRPENPTFDYRSIDYDVEMASAAQVAMSIPVSRLAAAALIDSLPKLAEAVPAVAAIETEEDLLEALQDGVNCSQVGESTILKIAYSHSSPVFALAVVEQLTDAYIEYTIRREHNPRAVDYYTDQIGQVQAEIDSLLDMRAEILAGSGYTELETDVRSASGQIWSLEDEYFKARSRRVGLEARYNGLLEAVRRDGEYAPSSRTGENVVLGTLKEKLIAEKTELAQLRLKYREDSVWVQRQLELVEAARREMVRERDNVIGGLLLDLEQARSTERELFAIIQNQRRALADYPDIERQVSSLQYQINTRTDLIESLHMKRGEVRLKSAADQRVSNVIPLNEPAIDMIVGGSKKAIYLTLATLLALTLGVVTALFIDNSDRRIYTKRQAEENLGVNVLGYVSDDGSERQR